MEHFVHIIIIDCKNIWAHFPQFYSFGNTNKQVEQFDQGHTVQSWTQNKIQTSQI